MDGEEGMCVQVSAELLCVEVVDQLRADRLKAVFETFQWHCSSKEHFRLAAGASTATAAGGDPLICYSEITASFPVTR